MAHGQVNRQDFGILSCKSFNLVHRHEADLIMNSPAQPAEQVEQSQLRLIDKGVSLLGVEMSAGLVSVVAFEAGLSHA